MRIAIAPIVVLALATQAAAQFESAEALIAKSDCHPIPGIPLDGMWSSQFFIGSGNDFITPVDGGYLDVVEHHHVRWNAEQRTYRGLAGRNMRVMAISDSRLLMEYDQFPSDGTWVQLVRWDGSEMHFFNFDNDDASDFAKHLRAQGVTSNDGTVSGDKQRIVNALKTLPLAERGHDSRWRRPKHAEMGEIWNYFEIVRWAEHQSGILRQIANAEPSLQRLGDLHQAHYFASQAYWRRLGNLAPLSLEAFEYGSMNTDSFASLAKRAKAMLEVLDQRIETRMKWVGEQIAIVEHIEHVPDPDDIFDFVHRASPGSLLKFHMVITDNNGVELENTKAKGEPVVTQVMGELPEGIQWALRTMGHDEKMTLNIPPELAFGPEYGVLRVELEIVEALRQEQHRPPLRDMLGYYIDTVDAEETPSGLRYRDLVTGEGDPPRRDQGVRIRTMSWNAVGNALGDVREYTTTVGADDMFAGITEALQSMGVGGQRVLFLPHHLADTSRERAGTAQCVALELLDVID